MSIEMVKNVYRCDSCNAQMIVQNPRGNTTPFMVRCRAPGCKEFANSTRYSLAQDILAESHLEFVYKGGTSGGNIVEVRELRPVPAFRKSFP